MVTVGGVSFSGWRGVALACRSDRIMRPDGSLYMERFFLRNDREASVRFHHLVCSDEQDLHDHPWDFVSLVLEGSYREHTPEGSEVFGPGDCLVRSAEALHRLELVSDEVWTFVSTGRVIRKWGFQTAAGWRPWAEYLGAGRYA